MAIRIDSTTEGLKRTTNLPASPTSFSACWWGYLVSDPGSAYTSMFQLGDGNGIVVGTHPSGATWMFYANGAENSAGAWVLTTWKHFAVVSQSGNQTLYIDGASASSIAASNIASNTNLFFGNDQFDEGGNYRLAAFKLWAAVLTLAELVQEARYYIPFRTANLNTWSPCLSSGDTKDYSGNDFTWTTNGTLTTEDGPPIAWSRGQSRVIIPAAATPGGRTTKNTRSNPLGLEVGMGWQMAHEHSQASK